MDAHRTHADGGASQGGLNHRMHTRVPLGTRALVNQPSLRPDPFEVVAENLSVGGAYFTSRYLFTPHDFFHCRMMLPGSGSVAGREVRLSAVVVRVDEGSWENEKRCGVGAFFVALDARDEEEIQGYVRQVRSAG